MLRGHRTQGAYTYLTDETNQPEPLAEDSIPAAAEETHAADPAEMTAATPQGDDPADAIVEEPATEAAPEPEPDPMEAEAEPAPEPEASPEPEAVEASAAPEPEAAEPETEPAGQHQRQPVHRDGIANAPAPMTRRDDQQERDDRR